MRNKKRIVWGSIAAVILILFIAFRFYQAIQADLKQDKEHAVAVALQETRMEQVNRVEPFIGDKPYMVVYGLSDREEEMIVWVNEDEVLTKFGREGVDLETVRDKTAAKNPQLQILRVSAGKLQDVLVWEVFYKQKEEEGERHYYDYYRFTDGELLDTYRMTGP
ncbi:DUF5590 domain-containing protein [Paenibacillus sp. J2TS4]|uniref:cell wall elongation regulator TseB-like domain-containing protein n=1 Tax=Paenibacillus sp. J2TS4 TaxID=2807194 RepID=UPI001B235D69|nr:DUF5590 domain-containing protein [Paenibacillus sp. J2TS4]GIP32433.1 hypothetical protein J2TS4_16430 [Paenibacillus sp. J2TS4]